MNTQPIVGAAMATATDRSSAPSTDHRATAAGRWPLWGAAAGALGMVGTLFSDTRPPETSSPITAEDVFALGPGGFHAGIIAGLAATFCLLVTAAAWRRWAADVAPRNLAAGAVSLALTASAGAMILAYGMKGSLAVYLPGGMDEGTYPAEGLFSVFLFLDFAPYVAWWGVCFASIALGWLSLKERLLPRWVGVVSIPFVLAPVAFMAATGLPGFPGVVDGLWLTVVSVGIAVGLRRSSATPSAPTMA